mmetsp:Transcript_123758/g.214163  ORF Transcript_123758/g.214163 Transcript_123758/m.214163 type:complete len:350 (+) Transcript_123758:82-1131(+)
MVEASGPERKDSASLGTGCMSRFLVFCHTYLFELGTLALVLGGLFLIQVDGEFDLIDSANLILQISTTIGYGDITPTPLTDTVKLVLSFYCLLCLVFASKIISHLGEWYVSSRLDEMKNVMHKIEKKAGAATTRREAEAKYGKYNRLIICFIQWCLPVIFGTIFYGWWEACTCSFGVSRVEGCVEDTYESCAETGGYKKSYVTCFYMSMMTVTTIGFGDYSPKSRLGRLLAVPWMILGVTASASFIGALADFANRNRKMLIGAAQIDKETFDKIDINHDGDLSLVEYRCFVLMTQGLLDEETMQQIDDAFKVMTQFSKDQHRLTWDEIDALKTTGKQHHIQSRDLRSSM